MPTEKWWAATVIGLAAAATLYIQRGTLDASVVISVVGFLSQRIVA